MPAPRLNGAIALVTGSRQGIGEAIARRLQQDGATVLGADLLADPSSAWQTLSCDVTDELAVTDLIGDIRTTWGPAEILVNNAGIYPVHSLEETTLEEWQRVLRVNMDSVFLMCRACVPDMKRAGWGRIINVSSNTFHAGIFPNYTAYVASKGGVIGFTRALASELGPFGVTVNAIAPGLVQTPTTLARRSDEAFEAVRADQAVPRRGAPDDLVSAVSFLAARDSDFVTGQTVVVDGGFARA